MRNKLAVGVASALIVTLVGPLAVADSKTRKKGDLSTPGTNASSEWVPVEQDVWEVFLEAPEYHFAKARENLAAKDNRKAAAEIREGAKMLQFQAKRLDAAVSDLYALANDVSAGKVTTGDKMNKVLISASKTLDYKEPLVPFAEGDDALFVESGQYHITQAKTKLAAKDQKGAAAEIRKATAFVKLEAAHSKRAISGDLKSALDEMDGLAKKAEGGADVAAKDIDQAFARARKALTTKL